MTKDTPTLQVTTTFRPVDSCTGSARSREYSVARLTATLTSWTLRHSTTNSSPENRLTTSPPRTADLNRWARANRTSSPLAWPKESLTSLNRSRSMKSTARLVPLCMETMSSRSSSSLNSERLPSPVSESW